MPRIDLVDGNFQVDAAMLAKALAISVTDLQRDMRDGTITSKLERGEGSDAGKMRLTFFSAHRRVRLVADAQGQVLSCTSADFRRRLPHGTAAST